ncbi:MAG: penicillin-binding protein 2 [Chromatiaceae bacterium]
MTGSWFHAADGERRLFVGRAWVAAILATLLLSLVVARVAHLQIELHQHFSTLSQDNRVRLEPLPPVRGLIYDTKGVLLAANVPSFTLTVTPDKVKDMAGLLEELSKLIRLDEADIRRFDRLRRQGSPYLAVPLRLHLTEEEIARVSLDGYRFPAVDIRTDLLRTYPLGVDTAHVLGYVARIDEEEVKRIDPANYRGTDFIGKNGLEKSYEEVLHGRVGYRQVEVNAKGRVLRTLESQPPVPGKDLRLHLDISLQRNAAAALAGRRGAVVAIDPRTGGVLALVSKPSFDPNPFVEGISAKEYAALRDDIDVPLFDRALRGQYPPGSTIKPFIALGGLETGVITTGKAKHCGGAYQLPNQSHLYRDWRKGGHGSVDMRRAIVESCDVYFYGLAHDLGIDRLDDFLTKFHFGRKTGVDLAGELGGLLPSKEWKRRVRHQSWYPGETLIVGIGQGSFLATPLQLAAATAAIADGGSYLEPRVAKALDAGQGQLEPIHAPRRDLGLDPAHVEAIVQAMTQVVESPRGTARRIKSPAYRIAGKTGTAQVFSVGQKETYKEKQVAARKRDHALFVAFAPVEDPRIAVAVLVENGGHGGSVAAPIARAVMDSYLLGREPSVELGSAPEEAVDDGD